MKGNRLHITYYGSTGESFKCKSIEGASKALAKGHKIKKAVFYDKDRKSHELENN